MPTLDYYPSDTEVTKARRKLRVSIAANVVGLVGSAGVLVLSIFDAQVVPRGVFVWVLFLLITAQSAWHLRKDARALRSLPQSST